MWIKYNANPVANRVEDCAIRAVAVALDISWEYAFDLIAKNAKEMGNVMHSNAVFGSVLRQHGFKRFIVPNSCPDCYSLIDFCMDNPEGVYVVGLDSHVVAVIDGNYIDTWDSGNEIPIYYWKEIENGI
ncbi:MAG: hypothetical protein J6S67_04430 [Methanobrevibacter sp.]|nr:hypothetical protein [Methanobrevibacter sp.]